MSSDRSNARTSGRSGEANLSRRRLIATSVSTLAAASMVGLPRFRGTSILEPPKVQAATSSTDRLDRILKEGKLRTGQFLQYKPYGFKNPKGEPDGFDADLTKMLAADMGVQPEFIDNTWDGIIPALLADKFDLITANLTVTLKRSLVVQFANPISFTSSGFIFRNEDKGRFSSLEKFNDPSITVSVLIQDAVHQTLQRFFPKVKVRDFNSAEEAILAVQTKKVDCSGAEVSFLTQYAKEHPGLAVTPVDYAGASSPAAMAFAAGPDNARLLGFVNAWVQFYYWTGKFEPIWKKWIPWNPVPKVQKFMAPV